MLTVLGLINPQRLREGEEKMKLYATMVENDPGLCSIMMPLHRDENDARNRVEALKDAVLPESRSMYSLCSFEVESLIEFYDKRNQRHAANYLREIAIIEGNEK